MRGFQYLSGPADFILLLSLDLLKDIGIFKVSLGLSPLYKRDDKDFNNSPFADQILSLVSKMNFLYHFREIGEHKDRYHTIKRQTYLALPGHFSLKDLIGMLKVNNII